MDTGILDHKDLNYEFGADCSSGVCIEVSNEVSNHHGTHVSGIIGSSKTGIVPGAKVVDVNIFGDSSVTSLAVILQALTWVYQDIIKRGTKGVINMSFGSKGNSNSYNDMFQMFRSIDVLPVVSAGNSNDDACLYRPAFSEYAFTVGSTNIIDKKSWFSNYGDCVDIYAPGEMIVSTSYNNDYKTESGTSMSAPYAVGVLIALWSEHEDWDIDTLISNLKTNNNILYISSNYEIFNY